MKKPSGRTVAGIAALGALVGLTLTLPQWGLVQAQAMVEPAQTFTLLSDAPGTWTWRLEDGRFAKGSAIVDQKVLVTSRGDMTAFTLAPDLQDGAPVTVGQSLATLRSVGNEGLLAELGATRESLAQERELAVAGARPSEIAEARKELALAEAVRAGELPNLDRVRKLAREGAVSQSDLDSAELAFRVREMEVELARASVQVLTSSARPEALAAFDAQILALDAQMASLESLLQGSLVASPIEGVLEVGGNSSVRVLDSDPVYLHIPIPEATRLRIALGMKVRFTTPSCPLEGFEATVTDIAEDASNLNGARIFWAAAELPNPGRILKSGMTGMVLVNLDGKGRGIKDWLRYDLLGY